MALRRSKLAPGEGGCACSRAMGFGSGHNTVLPQLDSVYHFVVNPDITLDDDAVSKLCAWMDAHPDVVMASAAPAVPRTGAEQYTAKRRPSFLALLARQVPLPFLKGRGTALSDAGRGSVTCPERSSSTRAVFVMRTKALFRRMGAGFDEGYFMYVGTRISPARPGNAAR